LAVFGNPDQFETVITLGSNRLQAVANGTCDIVTQPVTHTLSRDVYEASAKAGLTFSYPYAFTGSAVAGVPEFVDCVDNLDDFDGVCRDLRICVAIGTTHEYVMRYLFRGTAVVGAENGNIAVQYMNSGECNVAAVVRTKFVTWKDCRGHPFTCKTTHPLFHIYYYYLCRTRPFFGRRTFEV
jgi:ABC-type amino acid transport substrate-binding protein